MLARTPFTEVEGIGIYRLPNQWQTHRSGTFAVMSGTPLFWPGLRNRPA
jgi:hypothetical protein